MDSMEINICIYHQGRLRLSLILPTALFCFSAPEPKKGWKQTVQHYLRNWLQLLLKYCGTQRTWVNVSCGGITHQLSSRRHVTGKLVYGARCLWDSPLETDFSGETGKAWSLNLLFHFLLLCLPYLGHRLELKTYDNLHLLKTFFNLKFVFDYQM